MKKFQFHFDGSQMAYLAIDLLNESRAAINELPISIDGYYTNTGFYSPLKHGGYETITPAEFVARMKGEDNKRHQYSIGEYVMYDGLKCIVSENHNKDHLTIGIPTAVLRIQVAPITLTERIRHEYPKLTMQEIEDIVKMVRDEK